MSIWQKFLGLVLIIVWPIGMTHFYIDYLTYKKRIIFQKNNPTLEKMKVMESDMDQINKLIQGKNQEEIVVYKFYRSDGFGAFPEFYFEGCRRLSDLQKAFKHVGLEKRREFYYIKPGIYSINLRGIIDKGELPEKWCSDGRDFWIRSNP